MAAQEATAETRAKQDTEIAEAQAPPPKATGSHASAQPAREQQQQQQQFKEESYRAQKEKHNRATKQLLKAKRQQPEASSIPKPPPIDISSSQQRPQTSSSKSSKRPTPSYPPWADIRDSPRLSETIHNLALFLSSLPIPLHRATPRILARAISRVLAQQRVMPTNIAFDFALLFWRLIINVFFRSIQPRGAWRIPKEGPVIFVGAPHHNQFLDPLLLASEVRRGSGRRVAFLIAEKSIRRRFIGSAARLLQSSEYRLPL